MWKLENITAFSYAYIARIKEGWVLLIWIVYFAITFIASGPKKFLCPQICEDRVTHKKNPKIWLKLYGQHQLASEGNKISTFGRIRGKVWRNSMVFHCSSITGIRGKDKLFSSESHILECQWRESGDGDNGASLFLALTVGSTGD